MKKIVFGILGIFFIAIVAVVVLLGRDGTEGISDIDNKVPIIETGPVVFTARIGEVGSGLGVFIMPLEVTSDSRCPVDEDVRCVWAGTVKVRANVSNGTGTTTEQEFEFERTVSFGSKDVTLIGVTPDMHQGGTITPSDYEFTFRAVKASASPASQNTPSLQTYTSETLGISFHYPDTYFLETRELGDEHRGHFAIVLTEDTEENARVREGNAIEREGPVSISIELYQNLDQQNVLDWIKEDPVSNFSLSDGTYATTTIGGRQAFRYHWTGLYEADSIIFKHKDSIGVATVTFTTPTDRIRADFDKIMKTISFQ